MTVGTLEDTTKGEWENPLCFPRGDTNTVPSLEELIVHRECGFQCTRYKSDGGDERGMWGAMEHVKEQPILQVSTGILPRAGHLLSSGIPSPTLHDYLWVGHAGSWKAGMRSSLTPQGILVLLRCPVSTTAEMFKGVESHHR